MTLTELVEAAHREIYTHTEFLWQCFGPDCRAVIIGNEQTHRGTAVTDPSLRVMALDLGPLGWWVDPEYRTGFVRELEQQNLGMQGPELTETACLLALYNSFDPNTTAQLDQDDR